MLKLKFLIIFPGVFFILVQPIVFADNHEKLTGTWKLISFEGEFQDTLERVDWEGKSPTGYLIFTPEGRMMAVIEGEGRKPPKTDEDRLQLLRTMIAYSGMYKIEGNKFITHVDVSWNPAWNGTDQERYFKIEGDRLVITTAWAPSQKFTGRTTRAILVWEPAKK